MAAWAIIINKQKLLFIKRSNNTSRPGQWCFPGGAIKANETPEQACIREVKEETGLDIKIQKLLLVKNGSYYYACYLANKEQDILLKPNECSDFKWLIAQKLLALGPIMDLKIILPLLISMGYDIDLTASVKSYLAQS